MAIAVLEVGIEFVILVDDVVQRWGMVGWGVRRVSECKWSLRPDKY